LLIAKFVLPVILDLTPARLLAYLAVMFVLLVNTPRSILKHASHAPLVRTLLLVLLVSAHLALLVNTRILLALVHAPTASKVILPLLVVQSAALAPRDMLALPKTGKPAAKRRVQRKAVNPTVPPIWVPPS
jgi:hypothetical protein